MFHSINNLTISFSKSNVNKFFNQSEFCIKSKPEFVVEDEGIEPRSHNRNIFIFATKIWVSTSNHQQRIQQVSKYSSSKLTKKRKQEF